MPACDCDSNLKFDGVSRRYRTILWIVIGINAFMFVFETGASIAADSMALRAVYYTQTAWPDLMVAFLMSLLFLHSAFLIIRQARDELRASQRVVFLEP